MINEFYVRGCYLVREWIAKMGPEPDPARDGGPGDEPGGIYAALSFELFEMFYDLARQIKRAFPGLTIINCTENSIRLTYRDTSIELRDHGQSKGNHVHARMSVNVTDGEKRYPYELVLLKNGTYRWTVVTGPKAAPVDLTGAVLENIFKNALARYVG